MSRVVEPREHSSGETAAWESRGVVRLRRNASRSVATLLSAVLEAGALSRCSCPTEAASVQEGSRDRRRHTGRCAAVLGQGRCFFRESIMAAAKWSNLCLIESPVQPLPNEPPFAAPAYGACPVPLCSESSICAARRFEAFFAAVSHLWHRSIPALDLEFHLGRVVSTPHPIRPLNNGVPKSTEGCPRHL
ncbi:hypothetical protein BDV96DRAFT_675770 [Lophiotrema nucula]|uniref:Uncharacterized protein n=1 Tax=Lophiotrema nucula TaxID=690887 RepID=A0A6A5YHE1_9PLEO|nr:hypothetical protein BDV96DRAFT_675770 [Lophiotrema nucula]